MAESLNDLVVAFSESVNHTLIEMINEVAALRATSVTLDESSESVESLLNKLVASRQAQDRTEEIVVQLMRLKSRLAAAVVEAQAARDDAWNKVATTKKSLGFGDNYLSAKEKDAHYSVDIMEEEFALRRVQKMDNEVYSALDVCRMMLRGLDSARRDIDTRIRLMTIAGQLDR